MRLFAALVPPAAQASDAGSDIIVGNNPAASATFDGVIGHVALWDGVVLTSAVITAISLSSR